MRGRQKRRQAPLADICASREPAIRSAGWPTARAGLHVGGSAGFGKGNVTDTLMVEQVSPLWTEHVALHSSDDLGGAIYGAHLGYNWQLGDVVAGLEASFNGTGLDGSADYGPAFSVKTDLNWYSATVARLGYAEGAWLLYGFGGVAWGRGDVASRGDKPNGTYSDGGFHGFDPVITEVSLRDASSDHVDCWPGRRICPDLSVRAIASCSVPIHTRTGSISTLMWSRSVRAISFSAQSPRPSR